MNLTQYSSVQKHGIDVLAEFGATAVEGSADSLVSLCADSEDNDPARDRMRCLSRPVSSCGGRTEVAS